MPTLPPAAVAAHLPRSDRQAPAVALGEDRWAVAGLHTFVVADQDGVVDAGMWSELQTLKFDGETRSLAGTWVDPTRTPIEATVDTTSDADSFMRLARERLTRSMVILRNLTTDNGTRIVVQVRRSADGSLFSVVTADGPLTAQGRVAALQLEADVRESVGLD